MVVAAEVEFGVKQFTRCRVTRTFILNEFEFMQANSEKPNTAEPLLRSTWRRAQRSNLFRAMLWFLICVSLLLTLSLLVDRYFECSPGVRIGLLLAACVIALVGVGMWWRGRQAYRSEQVALRLETAHPKLDSGLISLVQFRKPGKTPIPRMVVTFLERQLQRDLVGVGPKDVISFQHLRPLFVTAVVLVVLFAGTLFVYRADAATWASRFLNPYSSVAYTRLTEIELAQSNVDLVAGESATLAAVASGQVPTEGQLEMRRARKRWNAQPLTSDNGRFSHAIVGLRHAIEYRFRIGDSISPVHSVRVHHPPRVEQAVIEVQCPQYQSYPNRQIESLNAQVYEGATLSWELALDKPAKWIDLVWENDGSSVHMKLDEEGRLATATQTITASSSYHLIYHWKLGDREITTSGAKRFVTVIADMPPSVDLVYPLRNLKSQIAREIEIEARASDDHGLSDVQLLYHINDGPERVHDLASVEGDKSFHQRFRLSTTELFPDARLGDIVSYVIRVVDTRELGPEKTQQEHRSRSRRLQFVTASEYAAYVDEMREGLMSELMPLYREANESSASLRRIVLHPERKR